MIILLQIGMQLTHNGPPSSYLPSSVLNTVKMKWKKILIKNVWNKWQILKFSIYKTALPWSYTQGYFGLVFESWHKRKYHKDNNSTKSSNFSYKQLWSYRLKITSSNLNFWELTQKLKKRNYERGKYNICCMYSLTLKSDFSYLFLYPNITVFKEEQNNLNEQRMGQY